MSRFLSVREAAQLLGVSQAFLYASVGAGSIPHFRVGDLIKFDADELRSWMRTEAERRQQRKAQ